MTLYTPPAQLIGLKFLILIVLSALGIKNKKVELLDFTKVPTSWNFLKRYKIFQKDYINSSDDDNKAKGGQGG